MTSSCFSSNFLCQSQAEESQLHLWFTQTDFKTIPERKLPQRYKVFSRRRAGIRISDNQEADCHPCHMGMLSDHCNSELHPLSPWSSGVSQGNSEAATQCCCINSISGKRAGICCITRHPPLSFLKHKEQQWGKTESQILSKWSH